MGDAIFTSTTDGMVRILSYPSMELQERTGAHCRAIYALALDPRGKSVDLEEPLKMPSSLLVVESDIL